MITVQSHTNIEIVENFNDFNTKIHFLTLVYTCKKLEEMIDISYIILKYRHFLLSKDPDSFESALNY
jgi:hypothetical protein